MESNILVDLTLPPARYDPVDIELPALVAGLQSAEALGGIILPGEVGAAGRLLAVLLAGQVIVLVDGDADVVAQQVHLSLCTVCERGKRAY